MTLRELMWAPFAGCVELVFMGLDKPSVLIDADAVADEGRALTQYYDWNVSYFLAQVNEDKYPKLPENLPFIQVYIEKPEENHEQ